MLKERDINISYLNHKASQRKKKNSIDAIMDKNVQLVEDKSGIENMAVDYSKASLHLLLKILILMIILLPLNFLKAK